VVGNPAGVFESSERSGNNETLSFANPGAGRWQIDVGAFEAYSGVTLAATLIIPTQLPLQTSLSGLSGVAGSETLYRVAVPTGAFSIQASTSGGTGDVDLYLKRASVPLCQESFEVSTGCFFDQASENAGNTESVAVNNPQSGDWYVDLSGYDDFSGVSLNISVSLIPPQPDLKISVTHTGTFTAGQSDAVYLIGVSNVGGGATSGAISVTDQLPAGMAATALSGTGWTCVLATLTCTRNDVLASAASFPSILLTINIAENPPSSATNIATVSGGGEVNPANDTASSVSIFLAPVIVSVKNAFGDSPIIAPNTWVRIEGSNLAPANDTRIWTDSDFAGGQLPRRLDGVIVNLNGEPAYIYYISPTQINVLTPPDLVSGQLDVMVTNNLAISNRFSVQSQPQSLSFFEYLSGSVHNVYARHLDGTLIGLSAPAKPGEQIYLVATGFGPTDMQVFSGAVTQGGNLPLPFPAIEIGGMPATVGFAGLVYVGTVQINLTVPRNLPDGILPITATYDGLSIQPNLMIAVQN
jgi:uncharacterized protein (TIGR03437 family)